MDFRADRVEVEPETFELELHGNVVVKVARYRIKSEELSLSRGPRGLEVDGEGEVALCPCAEAPITLGFQSVRESDLGAIDAKLLTQELPPGAFLDQDFRAWLDQPQG